MEIKPLVCGYTAQDHLLVDLDGCSLWQATQIAKMIMQEWQTVGDCLVIESSSNHYHLVYDSALNWQQIYDITQTLGQLGIVEKNFMWVRELRHDLTLRISPKMYREKQSPVPLPVELLGTTEPENSYGIQKYLRCLKAFIDDNENRK
jgi:hypothetical protein